jgi:hypothetical protein
MFVNNAAAASRKSPHFAARLGVPGPNAPTTVPMAPRHNHRALRVQVVAADAG